MLALCMLLHFQRLAALLQLRQDEEREVESGVESRGGWRGRVWQSSGGVGKLALYEVVRLQHFE